MTKAPKRRRHKNRLVELRTKPVLLTQEMVATLTGQDVTTVAHHENGTRGLTQDNIERYAKLYRVPSHELFFTAEDA